jgi:hypothetical protein
VVSGNTSIAIKERTQLEASQLLLIMMPKRALELSAEHLRQYEDLDFLREADEVDFAKALTRVGMDKPTHHTRAPKHFCSWRGGQRQHRVCK